MGGAFLVLPLLLKPTVFFVDSAKTEVSEGASTFAFVQKTKPTGRCLPLSVSIKLTFTVAQLVCQATRSVFSHPFRAPALLADVVRSGNYAQCIVRCQEFP